MTSASQPLVVVVTPVYNGGAYLRETMECVQAQTYPNLRHLVIDNASTDSTPQIIADFADGRVPVDVVRHKDLLPQMPNWNSAIAAVPEQAKWFRLLCADDTMAADSVEKMVAVGESDADIGVVGCIHDINGKIDPPLWPSEQVVFSGDEALRRFFEGNGLIIAPHMLIRTSARDGVKDFFDTVHNAADTDAVLRTLTSWKFGFCHEHLAHTREHEDTFTNREVAPRRLYLFDYYLFLSRYGAHAWPEEDAQAMLKRYRRHYLRRLLKIRQGQGGRKIWDFHMKRLDLIKSRPDGSAILDAFADQLMIKLGRRPGWISYPW